MKLHLYFARKFFVSFASVFLVFTGILMLIDIAEQLRKFGGKELSFGEILALSALNVPATLYQILPLVMILATIALFLGLARSSELVVTRAAGRSALRALMAPVLVSLALGGFAVAVMNPIVAATSGEYDARSAELRTGVASTLSITGKSLWLRQGGVAGQTVIHARETSFDGTQLRDVSFISFAPDGTPLRRIEAQNAVLAGGKWQMENAKIWPLTVAGSLTSNPERDSMERAHFALPTDLTKEQIRDSFAEPAAIPIWELPGFIEKLERAGFTARAHHVFLQSELALPLMLASMVLLGAGFTMRHARLGHTGIMVLMAILLGFLLYFLRNFARVLGENGQIPAELAAWAPPLAAILLSLGLLLHLEDG